MGSVVFFGDVVFWFETSGEGEEGEKERSLSDLYVLFEALTGEASLTEAHLVILCDTGRKFDVEGDVVVTEAGGFLGGKGEGG